VHARTVLISVLIHGALAIGLLRASERKRARRATVVAVTEKKKAEKPKEKPKPPPVPKTPPKVAANTPKAAPAPSAAAKPAAAPVHVEQPFSNDDAHAAATAADGPGLGVLPPRPTVAKPAAAKPLKVASALRHRQEGGEAAPAAQGEVVCEEEPSKPVPVFKPDIEYTNEARAAGVEGRLVLHLVIGADGSVTNVVVVASVDPALDAAAVAIVQKWRFRPALRCGKPVAGGEYTLARRFELGD
jgi:TonB family protein